MIITPAEFYAWLTVVPFVLAPGCFIAGACWRRSRPLVDELADLDTRVHGDDQIDAFLATLRPAGVPGDGLGKVATLPERPALAAVGPIGEAELRARTLHATARPDGVSPYTEIDAWRAEERAMPTGAESTASRLLHLIVGGMSMRDDLPKRAAAARDAIRRALEADQ
jgi:hypothetical protein